MSKQTVKLNEKSRKNRCLSGRSLTLTGLVLLMLGLASCGYKGPLSLPSSGTNAHLPVSHSSK